MGTLASIFYAPTDQDLQKSPMYPYASGREQLFFAVEQQLRLINETTFDQVPQFKYRSFYSWPFQNLPNPLRLLALSMGNAGHVEIDIINSYLISTECHLLGIKGCDKFQIKNQINGSYKVTNLNHIIDKDSIYQEDCDYINSWQD